MTIPLGLHYLLMHAIKLKININYFESTRNEILAKVLFKASINYIFNAKEKSEKCEHYIF